MRLSPILLAGRDRPAERLEGAEINSRAKVVLATEATASAAWARGGRSGAAGTAAATFAGGGSGEALPRVETGGEIGDACGAGRAGLLCVERGSQAQGRRGRVKLDGEAVSDVSAVITVTSSGKLSLGKKKHGLLLP
jgi:tyrosyl-tRNA synthetase